MIKARIVYRDGKWWSRRLGVTGCGSTPKLAYDDMMDLYINAVRAFRHKQQTISYVRMG